eukprot:761846-Hanusia_phi.AAC.1
MEINGVGIMRNCRWGYKGGAITGDGGVGGRWQDWKDQGKSGGRGGKGSEKGRGVGYWQKSSRAALRGELDCGTMPGVPASAR